MFMQNSYPLRISDTNIIYTLNYLDIIIRLKAFALSSIPSRCRSIILVCLQTVKSKPVEGMNIWCIYAEGTWSLPRQDKRAYGIYIPPEPFSHTSSFFPSPPAPLALKTVVSEKQMLISWTSVL